MFMRNKPCFFSSCCRIPGIPASPGPSLDESMSLFTPLWSVSHARTARCARTSGGSGTVGGFRKSSARVRFAWMMALRCVFWGCSNIMSPILLGGRSLHGVTSTVCMKNRAGSERLTIGSLAPCVMPYVGGAAAHVMEQKSYSRLHSFLSSARASIGVMNTCFLDDIAAAVSTRVFFFVASSSSSESESEPEPEPEPDSESESESEPSSESDPASFFFRLFFFLSFAGSGATSCPANSRPSSCASSPGAARSASSPSRSMSSAAFASRCFPVSDAL
mmetsp:Transcript_4192/g.18989  ORF Transcript_4192/g.18989 Transcript_4192/m.18989 type:complete len:276 (+) Transcript_4192:4154-4981(+)